MLNVKKKDRIKEGCKNKRKEKEEKTERTRPV